MIDLEIVSILVYILFHQTSQTNSRGNCIIIFNTAKDHNHGLTIASIKS